MYNGKKFIAIIPARGGSKRLPKKNLLNLNGKPLIAHTIESALLSKYIDEVVISTDSQEILDFSKKYKVSLPFIRPDELSSDTATKSSVIKHAIEFYQNELKSFFDYIVYLQPTSPLRSEVEIDGAIEYMYNSKSDAVISVCKLSHPIEWSGTLPNDGNMESFIKHIDTGSRSQELKQFYRLNGAIYICDTKKFLEQECMFIRENIYAFKMSKEKSVDIDTKEDLNYAEFLMRNKIESI